MKDRLDKARTGHQEVSLHGQVDNRIEYQVTVAACDAFARHFHEHDGHSLRLFAPGSEFVIGPQGVSFAGNGGSCCRYMFGIDAPRADQLKPEVLNRLTLYGTSYGDDGSLQFSDRTDGSLGYSRIFLDGNAVTNYFFFVGGLEADSLGGQQQLILMALGKLFKRSPHLGNQEEHPLLEEACRLLGHRCTLLLIRLTHQPHRQYRDMFRRLYFAHKSIPDADYRGLCELAQRLEIDDYPQERIRIDTMYQHRDNRRLVDEYRSILIDCGRKAHISPRENARLNRLKNLWVRNKIPAALFQALDRLLLGELATAAPPRAELADCRRILRSFVHRDRPGAPTLRREEMVTLLTAKQRASIQRDRSFEQLLLETSGVCDERLRDGAEPRLLEDFSRIVTYFDRFDHAATHVNQLAFMVNYRLTEPILRSLLGCKTAFDQLRPGLFEELLFRDLRRNGYLSHSGRQKLDALLAGLGRVEAGALTLPELQQQLQAAGERERLAQAVLQHLKQRIHSSYSRFHTRNEQALLKEELASELQACDLLRGPLPDGMFEDAILWVQQEALYLNHLLPRILQENNPALREEFLGDSSLDRFAVEELEREYCQLNRLDPARLPALLEAAG